MTIQTAETDKDILKCWKALKELRPNLAEANLLATLKEMIAEGYRLDFIEGEDGIALSVIGFRYLQFTYNGKHFYIDGLSTLPGAGERAMPVCSSTMYPTSPNKKDIM